MVVVAVYKVGALEVVRRLTALQAAAGGPDGTSPNEAASAEGRATSKTRPQAKKRHSVWHYQDGHTVSRRAANAVAEERGYTHRVGTITRRIEVTWEGEVHSR